MASGHRSISQPSGKQAAVRMQQGITAHMAPTSVAMSMAAPLASVHACSATQKLGRLFTFDNGVPLGQPTLAGEASDLVELAVVRDCCAYDEALRRWRETFGRLRGDAARLPRVGVQALGRSLLTKEASVVLGCDEEASRG